MLQLNIIKNIIILYNILYIRKGEKMEEFDVIFLDDDKKTVLISNYSLAPFHILPVLDGSGCGM